MNLILERTDQVKYFTYLPQVFEGLNIDCRDYDWYISDIETNCCDLREGWYSGDELAQLIYTKDIQFIWAVLSAFTKENRCEVIDIPYIDVNENYWNKKNVKPQLDSALFEIGCWDSSATLLIGLDKKLASNYKNFYSDAREL